ncbi:MAG TPA: thiamine pyrophosphate-binding protein, partial [Clostridia bacterium]|nr:thiamine pyrophosphate-binding protein [Clostridia bacterium]
MSGKEYNGGELVSEVFKKEGIKYIFGLPGGHIYPMIEGCEDRGIKYIGVRHEMTAAFMAEGWALATGRVGVCTGTAGPGFTNLITGLANSDRGGIPVLCLAGKARVTENDRNALQDFNQIDMVKQMTRHARSVLEPQRIPEYVGRAISYATTGSPGPVYLEIPRDIMESKVDAAQVEFQNIYRTKSTAMGCPEDIQGAVELIRKAEKPLVVAGGGVWWSQAQKEMKDFVEKSGIPLFTRNAARGTVSDSHPLHMGIAAHMHPLFNAALSEADCIIIIGTRPGYTLDKKVFTTSHKIIRVDIDPAELTNQLDIDVGIVGDAKNVLRQLTDAIEKTEYPEWVQFIQMMNENMMSLFAPMASSQDEPINPMRLVSEIAKRVDQETIVVIDGGDSAKWGNLIIPATGPGQYLSIAGTSFGPLGVGIPYAMAAKL